LLLLSWFLYIVQYQKWKKAVDYLKNAALYNLGAKNGGTKQTQELYSKAVALYEDQLKQSMSFI
jgi:hypothetical protein